MRICLNLQIVKNSFFFVLVKRFYAVVNLFDCIYLVTFRYGLYIHCGDDSAEVPPVLIPNTEVKLSCAESTRRATDREDRLLPLYIPR